MRLIPFLLLAAGCGLSLDVQEAVDIEERRTLQEHLGEIAQAQGQDSGTITSDIDADGMLDDLDLCPKEAEDIDGILDSDGCPEQGEVTCPQVATQAAPKPAPKAKPVTAAATKPPPPRKRLRVGADGELVETHE